MEEKERYEYYPKQNQLYDKINDELYCLGIKQDKTRLVDFLNLMNEDWWTLYERNKELREENQQLKQQLAEKEKEIKNLVIAHFESEINKPVLTTTQMINQDKISFAIEQLEKVKEFSKKEIKECNKLLQEELEDDYYIQSVGARQSMCYEFKREIDNQINELKGEKNDKV